MKRKPLIAGNWKMNGLAAQRAEFDAVSEAVTRGEGKGFDLLLCPPATLIASARQILPASIFVGAQDCHEAESGAHTGDLSAVMLADAGASHVIVGHSERRADHHESDDLVRRKADAARKAGLVAVVCVGETEDQRDRGETLDVLGRQLAGSLSDDTDAETTIVAYEPVWAIGTGKTPTIEDVATVHSFLREQVTERFGENVGKGLRILYGGSVKPGNAAELLAVENVDGALVGGASLEASDFMAICKAVRLD